MKKKLARIICRLFGHKPAKEWDLYYPVTFDPPIGRLYCERCGELLDERG